jgi:hypothetical protein
MAAWKAMRMKQLAAFNTVLVKNHLRELKVAPDKLAGLSCGVVAGSY